MELAADKRAASPLDFELEECDGKTLLRLFRADPQQQMSSMAAAMAEAAVAGGGESVAGSPLGSFAHEIGRWMDGRVKPAGRRKKRRARDTTAQTVIVERLPDPAPPHAPRAERDRRGQVSHRAEHVWRVAKCHFQ